MNPWINLSLQLLPTFIQIMENIPGLRGHQKKAAVQNILAATANGVSTVMPQHAAAAQDAATVASATIDGFVKVLNDVGALKSHATPAPAPVAVAPAPEPLSPPVIIVDTDPTPTPAPTPAPTSVPDATGTSVVIEGPGLHTIA